MGYGDSLLPDSVGNWFENIHGDTASYVEAVGYEVLLLPTVAEV